jgi:hypothetical protein
MGVSPAATDALLYELARSGDLIFRGFQRGIDLAPGPRAGDQGAVNDAAGLFLERFKQFGSRLDEMIHYAELRDGSVRCRAAHLADYLTGSHSSWRCGLCDLCAPAHPVPWSPIATVDPEPLQIEPTLAILEAVRDHDNLYGAGTLKKILLGETYGMGEQGRYSISAYARNSEHFGILRGAIAAERLQQHFDRLIGGRQLEVAERSRASGGGTYQAVRLTNMGRDILAGAVPIPGNEQPLMVNPEPVAT